MKAEVDKLIELLGSDNKKRIQDAITEELIDNLVESIKYEWVALPSEFEELWKDVIKKYEVEE